MALYALGDDVPEIHPSAFVHPEATVIGRVRIGAEASIWPQAVLRGDSGAISVGAHTSVQDGAVIHCTGVHDTVIGDECVIGHLAHLEGCEIERFCLIGVGAIVLERAVVRTGALVAAGAVVRAGTEVPPSALAVGVPAVIKPDAVTPDQIGNGVRSYLEKVRRYPAEMRRLD
jgi:acetyltransferase-like isoleucine patch superfamily enzyme